MLDVFLNKDDDDDGTVLFYKNICSRKTHERAHVKGNKTNKTATDGISAQRKFHQKKKNFLAPTSLSEKVSLLSVCGIAELNTSDRRRSLLMEMFPMREMVCIGLKPPGVLSVLVIMNRLQGNLTYSVVCSSWKMVECSTCQKVFHRKDKKIKHEFCSVGEFSWWRKIVKAPLNKTLPKVEADMQGSISDNSAMENGGCDIAIH